MRTTLMINAGAAGAWRHPSASGVRGLRYASKGLMGR
jgi:hypothetical protein